MMMFSISTAAALTDAGMLDQVCRLTPLFARRGETGEMFFWMSIFGA